jgi:hypothetical protein
VDERSGESGVWKGGGGSDRCEGAAAGSAPFRPFDLSAASRSARLVVGKEGVLTGFGREGAEVELREKG